MQDEMQKEHIGVVKKLLSKLLNIILNDVEKKKEELKNFEKTKIAEKKETAPSKNIKDFMRRHKNQGIYKMQDLDKNLANELSKKLRSYNQDFVKTNNGNGKFDIVVTKANASLMDELLPKCQKAVQTKLDKKAMTKEQRGRAADSITNVVSRAKREANKLKERHSERSTPTKHKDIGAI